MTRKRSIRVNGLGGVDALAALRDGPLDAPALLILAPGAGAPAASPFMTRIAQRVAGAGIGVLRFDFPYRIRGKKSPDRAAILDETWDRVLAYAKKKEPDAQRVLGGKSMGGRYATHLLARDESAAVGGVVFGYPLHRPAKADARPELRDAHLADVSVPLLFFGGTRDALARIELMEKTVDRMDQVDLVVYDEANHDFAVPKRTGTTRDEIIDDMAERTATWIDKLTT